MKKFPEKFTSGTALAIVVMHVIACCVVWHMFTAHFPIKAWLAFVLMWGVSLSGTTLGYHRYATHRAFRCPPFFEKLLYFFAATAFQGTGIWWAESHAQHHAYADEDGDPHRPGEFGGGFRGFLWSHMLWLFFETKQAPPDYPRPKRFREDASLTWQKRYYLPLALCGFAIPYLIAGWNGVLLAGFFRVVICWHITWSVNSFCHVFGSHAVDASGKIFETGTARNFPLWCLFSIFAVLSWGEFWHANHHARQRSAYLGWRWYEFDPGGWAIRIAKKFGIVSFVINLQVML